ncbi:MAG: putative toxin-antitoxin system toxin component, PIN family [Pyrinomonadaceae bacterium]
MAEISTLVEFEPSHYLFERDPKDGFLQNLAIAGNAGVLVTRDNDLLDLMTDRTEVGKDFRRRFRTIKVMKPEEFLSLVPET